jgi:hypothetical protein
MQPGVVAGICDSNTWETEAGGIASRGQSGLHSKTWSQKTKAKTNKQQKLQTVKH